MMLLSSDLSPKAYVMNYYYLYTTSSTYAYKLTKFEAIGTIVNNTASWAKLSKIASTYYP